MSLSWSVDPFEWEIAMKSSTNRIRRARLGTAVVMFCLAAVLGAIACGADSAGFACFSQEDCEDDLSCEEVQMGAVCSEGFCGCDYSQSLCTASCESDDDCPHDLVCNRASTCGGPNDLCGRP